MSRLRLHKPSSVGGYSNKGWTVVGIGRVRTLRKLGVMLDAAPTLHVIQLGNYNASGDGVFEHSAITTTYEGTYEGGGFEISGFRIVDNSATPGNDNGLFASVGNTSGIGTVKNLTLSGSLIQTAWERETIAVDDRYLLGVTNGGLTAFVRGTLDNCTSNMILNCAGSGGQHGGLVGRILQWSDKTITNITQAANAVVTIANHSMATGARLFLKDIVGMTELNDTIIPSITVIDANTFSIGVDTTTYGAYVSGGIAVGAGTVKNCHTNASVTINSYCYNTYQSQLVGSNRGLIEYCTASVTSSSIAPGGYNPAPILADYYDTGVVFTGSITSNVLNATSVDRGTIAVGMYVYAPNKVPGAVVTTGQRVLSLGTGTGGVGTYNLSAGVNVSSRDLMMALTDVGTFTTTGAWTGNIAGDSGIPTLGASPLSTIRYCQSWANLLNGNNTDSANYSGGIVGVQGESVTEDCISYGTTTGGNGVGGIIGNNADTFSIVRRCISFGAVNSQLDVNGDYCNNIGGIFGQNYGTVIDVINYSDVMGGSGVGGIGGLVRGTGVVTRFASFGNVTSNLNLDGTTNSNTGGLFGQTLNGCVIDQGYVTGITRGYVHTGAAIGYVQAGSTITNVRWNSDSTGSAVGTGLGTSAGVTVISDAALLAAIPAGFDANWSRLVTQCSFYPYINTLPLADLAGGVLPAPTIVLNPPLAMSIHSITTIVDSTDIVMPADILANDRAYLIDFSQNIITSAPALATPAGFTNILAQSSAATHGTRIAQCNKLLDGTEGGTTLTGIAAGTRGALKVLVVVRPNRGSTWTRLNARCVVNGAGTGVANQTMGAGTSPCINFCAGFTQSGTIPDPQISTGDNDRITITSIITPANSMTFSYKINNTGAAANTLNADTVAGLGLVCVNKSLSA